MKMDLTRTIVAVSSGVAPARRAIVRLTGTETRAILSRLLAEDPAAKSWLATRRAAHRRLRCQSGLGSRTLVVDCYFWPDHRSFTGECCAELHLLGCLPLVESLVEKMVALGAHPADRGEFTLRSFLAGKIDLTQAEAVLGVIEAQDPTELNEALGQLGGNLSRPVKALRDRLLELTAHLEAGLDFVEEDIEFISAGVLQSELTQIAEQLAGISQQLESRGSRSRTANVVLVGLPNAGKSSLFNRLLGTARAIVSGQAGTTRDAVTAPLRIGDLEVEIVDTAGLEELQEATPRALAQQVLQTRLAAADAIVFCVDLSQEVDADWIAAQRRRMEEHAPVLLVGTKQDLACDSMAFEPDLSVGREDAESLDALKRTLQAQLAGAQRELRSTAMHHAMLRSRESIDSARVDIQRALENSEHDLGDELVASELRLALDHLASVIGEIHTEDILGQIFSRFCIGK